MTYAVLDSKIKNGLALAGIFLVITIALLFAIQPIPVLGNLIYIAAHMSSPFLFMLAANGTLRTASTFSILLATLVHYFIGGFLLGYLFPFELSMSRSYFKAVLVRYSLFFTFFLVTGLVLAIYAGLHD